MFFYNKNAGLNTLKIDDNDFNHIFKVRRLKTKEVFFFRNFKEDKLFKYKLLELKKRSAILNLEEVSPHKKVPKKYLHIAWCVIDTKIIEKTLASLNEIGLSKISFIYAKRSQKNFDINKERIKKIIIASNIQCGRTDFMQIDIKNNIKEFIKENENTNVLDFNGNTKINSEINTVLVGPEGGYSNDEREILKNYNKISFKNNIILRSENAVRAISSKILL